MMSTQVRRVDLEDLSPYCFLRDYVAASRPVILRLADGGDASRISIGLYGAYKNRPTFPTANPRSRY